jgi:hypothetical protein
VRFHVMLPAVPVHERALSDFEPLGDAPHAPAIGARREALVLCVGVIYLPPRYATGNDGATRHSLGGPSPCSCGPTRL